MFLAMIILVMFVCPTLSIVIETLIFKSESGLLIIAGKWFVFWGVGVRLLTAGVRQALQPKFTAQTIFGITDVGALAPVRELGFANLSLGLLGAGSLLSPAWVVPSAIAGATFYGLAVSQHLVRDGKNATETVATVSGVFMFLVLLAILVGFALWI